MSVICCDRYTKEEKDGVKGQEAWEERQTHTRAVCGLGVMQIQ